MNRYGELRRQMRLTQTEVARYMGVTRTAVSKWENGLGFPEAGRLLDLAKLYKCNVTELLRPDKKLKRSQKETKGGEKK